MTYYVYDMPRSYPCAAAAAKHSIIKADFFARMSWYA